MRFVDYILSHMQYNNILNYCVINPIMWCLVSLVKTVLDSLEVLLNAAFAMFGFIYSPQVINFIRPWIGWLWVPIAISALVLGINLIINNNDIIEKGVHKKFIQNFCLLMIVVCLLPAIFIGSDKTADSNVWGSERNTGQVGENGIISIFTSGDKKNSPFWETMQNVGDSAIGNGEKNNGSMSEKTIANHIVDLQYIYLKYGGSDASKLKSNNWSETAVGGKPISTDCNSYMTRSKGVWDDIGNSLNDLITPDKSENEPFKGVIKDINALDPRSDNRMFLTKDDDDDNIKRNNLDPFGSGVSTPSNSKFKQYDDNCEVDGAVYLFYSEHAKHTWGEGADDYTYISKPMDKPFMDWYLLSNFPHRYYVDWGLLLVDMIIQCIIIIGISFKVVSIIFELAFSQLFAILVATTDLTNGQRTKEVLKIIMSLVLTVGFTGVLFQFYRLATSYINGTFTNDWIRLFFTIFVGLACIKGTTILSKVLGIGDGGGVGRQLGALAGVAYGASRVAKGAVNGVKKVGSFAFGAGRVAGRAGSAVAGTVAGAQAARRQRNSIGTTGGINTKNVKPGASSRGATPINGATANAQANRNKPNAANTAGANANKPDTKGKAGESKGENTAGEKADTNAANAENSKPLIGGADATNTAAKAKENGADSKASGKADDKAQGQNAETEKATQANAQGENSAETKNAENTDIGGSDAKGEAQAENNSDKSDGAVSGASNENAPANANAENEGAVIGSADTNAQGKAESENAESKNADIGGAEMDGNAPATANAETGADSSEKTADIGGNNSSEKAEIGANNSTDKTNAENGMENNTDVGFANADNKQTAHTDTEPTIGGMESNTQTADGSGSDSGKGTAQISDNESNMPNVGADNTNVLSDDKRSNADISQANAHSEAKQTERGNGTDAQSDKPNFDTPTASVSGVESTAQNSGSDNAHTDIASSEVNSNKPVDSSATSYNGTENVSQHNSSDNSHADIASSGVNSNKPVENATTSYNGADNSNTAEYGRDHSAGITEANANVGTHHTESGNDNYKANPQIEKSNLDTQASSVDRVDNVPQYSDSSSDNAHTDIASSGVNSNKPVESSATSYNGTENVPQHNTGDNSHADVASSGVNSNQSVESSATSYNGADNSNTAEYGRDRSTGITEANANVGVSHSESGNNNYNANAQIEKSNLDTQASSVDRVDNVPQYSDNGRDNAHTDIASSGVNSNKPVESNASYNGADNSNTAEYGRDRSAGITEANANVDVSRSESGSDSYVESTQSEKSSYDVQASSVSGAESATQRSVNENANADMASYSIPTAGASETESIPQYSESGRDNAHTDIASSGVNGNQFVENSTTSYSDAQSEKSNLDTQASSVSGTDNVPQYSDSSRDSAHTDIASSGINSNQSAESNTASYNGTENVPQYNTGDNSYTDITSSGANSGQPVENTTTSYNGAESFDTGRSERSNDTSRFNEADNSSYSDTGRETEMPEYDSRGDYRQSQHNADAQQYAEDNFATIRNEYADRMQAYENKHSRTLLHPWRSENSRTGTGYYEEARRAAGETQGNILDDAMNRMVHDSTLDTRSAINETLVDAGYSPAHADMISREMANSGVMDMHRQELHNQISELAQQTYVSQGSKLGDNIKDGGTRYAQGNDEIRTQGEYYRDAASKVLSDRGIDSSAYAETLGNSVCVRDNYQTLRDQGHDIRDRYNALNPESHKQMSVQDGFRRAVEESSLGINGDIDKEVYFPTDKYSSSKYSDFGRESSSENDSRTSDRSSSGWSEQSYGKKSGGFVSSFRHSFSRQKEKTEAKRIDREENGMRHYEFNKHENSFERKNKKR